MKRILSLSLAALAFSHVTTHAGIGTMIVQNNNGGTIVPLFDIDGTTKIAGANYSIAVYVSDNGSLGAQIGPVVSPGANGRFTAGQQDVPGSVAGGTVSLIVAVWDNRTGVDYATATAKNQSFPFLSPILGGDVDNDPTTPALTASSMALNFKGLALVVPEPSTVALGALGLGGLIFFSRRK